MFPILLNTSGLKIMLVGNGPAAVRRLKLLDESGAASVAVFADNASPELKEAAGKRLNEKLPGEKDFSGISLVMIADFPEEISGKMAAMAKKSGALVNVEDSRKYCDYHVPAMVRRGDFLLTVSTGGASPRLARRVRQILEKLFPAEWAGKVRELKYLRNGWKSEGMDMKGVAGKTDEWLEKNSLLENICKAKELNRK